MSVPVPPLVSIGLPVLNARGSLPLALASIRAQTYEHWELLIADDGSTDGTVELIQAASRADPRIRAVPGTAEHGIAPRLNEILDAANGPLFARMDADDVAYPQRLERQVNHLLVNPGVDLVGSSMLIVGADGTPIGKRVAPAAHEEICRRPNSGFPLFHPTWMARTEWIRSHGYSRAARRSEDQDLLARAYRNSRFANIPEPLVGYREEDLRLGPILTGRAYFTLRTARRLWRERRIAAMLAAVGEQLAKAAVDALAISLKLERKLLRHRARPLAESDREQWGAALRLVRERTSGDGPGA